MFYRELINLKRFVQFYVIKEINLEVDIGKEKDLKKRGIECNPHLLSK